MRALTATEAALVRLVIRGCGSSAAPELEAQITGTMVEGGIATLLHLEVAETAPRADVPDGPLPARYFVGADEGEILVWVKAGCLDALEFAWWSDAAPEGMPLPESVTPASD